MKKRIALTILLVLALVLVACGPQGTTTTTTTGAPGTTTTTTAGSTDEEKDPVTIRTAVWGGEARFKLYDQVFALYEEEFQHVTIQKEYLAWSDYWVKKATQAAGNNLPDMTNISWYSIREYADRGMYLPLESYVESGVIDIDNFLDLVLDTGKVDGVLYGVPIGVSIDGLMANKTLIEGVGAQIPAFEVSYDDFKNYVIDLQTKLPDGVWAITDQGRDQKQTATWIRQEYGVEFYSDDGNSLGFSKEALIEWMNMWQDWREAGAVVPPEVSAELEGGDPWADTVQAREWVCLWFSPNNQLTIYQLYAEGDIVIGRQPFSANGPQKWGEILLTTAFGIASNSTIPDETAHLVNWFPHSVEGNRIFNADQGFVGVPEVVDMLVEKWEADEPQKVEFFNHANSVATSNPAVAPTIPWAVGHTSVVSAFERQYDEVRYGQKSIEQMVDDFFAEANGLLAGN